MLKEAMEYLLGLGKAVVHYENGQAYSDKRLYLMTEPTAEPITIHSLSGLVEYLKSEYEWDERLMVHVVSPTEVRVFDALNGNKGRNQYIQTTALLPSFNFGNFHDVESFNIKLQSCFVNNDDRSTMLKVVGNIKEEAVNTIGDDGVSQSVVAKTGVATVGNVVVPNPVLLAPYRTFIEVKQPESEFIFRMKTGPTCALFEADGGAWKIEAMNNIKMYLQSELGKELQEDKLVIIA
ncbi:hypothetical protein AWH56_005340 [Anaerobacillus isosaccharinicus]|uniref:Uncharacterized protein n=1 Tax=Anaerobacillus isosaccharinicus TaxID=1532552 RepID=A0A1S2L965_9BACI|nr:hypothetical protein [Anaerobacillus isosaccharinicus]MBA5584550.1 hypothetical protein [Anaerobacillus isosaccharinicus]QOY37066.1 hypothetical protein AWH56_005340 [Anaerobacillus isosaccharinicus]